MRENGDDVIATLSKAAGFGLTRDLDSLGWVEAHIGHVRELLPAAASREGWARSLSIFLGEVLVKQAGGRWVPTAEWPCIELPSGTIAFPLAKVAKQIESGSASGEEIVGFAETAVALSRVRLPKP